MPNVPVVDRCAQFHLDGEDTPVVAFDDQIDFVFAGRRSEMPDPRFRCLGVDADVDRGE